MDENKTVKSILQEFLCAKKYYSDMIFDINHILKLRADIFQNKLTVHHTADFDYVTNKLALYEKKPKSKYRLYIICGMRYVALTYIDIPEEFAENILYGIKNELSEYDESDVNQLPVDFINTVYMFKHSKIIYSCDIAPSHLALLMNILNHENLIDDRQQHRWTKNFVNF